MEQPIEDGGGGYRVAEHLPPLAVPLPSDQLKRRVMLGILALAWISSGTAWGLIEARGEAVELVGERIGQLLLAGGGRFGEGGELLRGVSLHAGMTGFRMAAPLMALREAWLRGASREDSLAVGRQWGLTGLAPTVDALLAPADAAAPAAFVALLWPRLTAREPVATSCSFSYMPYITSTLSSNASPLASINSRAILRSDLSASSTIILPPLRSLFSRRF